MEENTPEPSKPALVIPPSWKEHFDLLGHLCQFSQDIILVLGETSFGKTSFTQLFGHYSLPGIRKVVIDGKRIIDSEQLMQSLAQGFHLPWDASTYEKSSVSTEDHGQIWAVIVDDADLLSDQVLSDLFRLVDFTQPLRQQLRLVLFGRPPFERHLEQEVFQTLIENRTHSLELSAWNREPASEINSVFQEKADDPGTEKSEDVGSPTVTLAQSRFFTKKTALKRVMQVGLSLGMVVAGSYLIALVQKEPLSPQTLPDQAHYNAQALDSLRLEAKAVPNDKNGPQYSRFEFPILNDIAHVQRDGASVTKAPLEEQAAAQEFQLSSTAVDEETKVVE